MDMIYNSTQHTAEQVLLLRWFFQNLLELIVALVVVWSNNLGFGLEMMRVWTAFCILARVFGFTFCKLFIIIASYCT